MSSDLSASSIQVTKASGELVPFSQEKLEHSLFKAGASAELTAQIVAQVRAELYEGIKTQRIYQRAFTLLKKSERVVAARYKLKRAIMELGPSGYPFERFIGEIFKANGFEVQVGIVLPGVCITHEVDVLGDRPGLRVAAECKFGNKSGKRIDIKTALYVQARMEDLKRKWLGDSPKGGQKFESWLVTNGEFTSDAVAYGHCVGMHLVSWSHPHQGNLKQLIEGTGLYPVTSLTQITKKEKQALLAEGVVLARNVKEATSTLDQMRIPPTRRKRAMKEIEDLC